MQQDKNISISFSKDVECVLKIDASISKDKYKEIVGESLKEIGKGKSLPGFRKGKVPVKKIIDHFGNEVLRKSLDTVVLNVLHKTENESNVILLKPYHLRKVDWDPTYSLDADKDIKVRIECEYSPNLNIEIEKIAKEMKLDKPEMQITEDELKKLEHSLLKANFSTMKEKSDVCEEENVIIFDILDSKNNIVKKDAKMMVSKSTMEESFYDNVLKKSAGEEFVSIMPISSKGTPMYYKNISKDQNLDNGKFIVRIKSVQEIVVPEISEEIAVNGMGADSIEDFRNKLKIQAEKKKKIEVFAGVEEKIMNFWFDNYKIDIPRSWTEKYCNEVEASRKKEGKELTEKDRESLFPIFKKGIAFNVALSEFADSEKIVVEDKDLMEYINKMLLTGRMSQQLAIDICSSPEKKNKYKTNAKVSKAADIMVDKYLSF